MVVSLIVRSGPCRAGQGNPTRSHCSCAESERIEADQSASSEGDTLARRRNDYVGSFTVPPFCTSLNWLTWRSPPWAPFWIRHPFPGSLMNEDKSLVSYCVATGTVPRKIYKASRKAINSVGERWERRAAGHRFCTPRLRSVLLGP
jgi:hypothetical protein